MRFQPVSEVEFNIMPETEVEAFYISRLLNAWQVGNGKFSIKSGIMGSNPQTVLEFNASPPKLIPFSFAKK